jgi:hypothetical protein
MSGHCPLASERVIIAVDQVSSSLTYSGPGKSESPAVSSQVVEWLPIDEETRHEQMVLPEQLQMDIEEIWNAGNCH